MRHRLWLIATLLVLTAVLGSSQVTHGNEQTWLVTIPILKRWSAPLSPPTTDAIVIVTVNGQSAQVTCPYDPQQPFVLCQVQLEVTSAFPPTVYDLAEIPPPGFVAVGVGSNFPLQCLPSPQGPYAGLCYPQSTDGGGPFHQLWNRQPLPEGQSVLWVYKIWSDDDPTLPPAPQQTDLEVTINGVTSSVTCPPTDGLCGAITFSGNAQNVSVTLAEPNPPPGWIFSGSWDLSAYICPAHDLPLSQCRVIAAINTRRDVLRIFVQKQWVGDEVPGQPASITVSVGQLTTETLTCPGQSANEDCGMVIVQNFPGFENAPVSVTEGALPDGWYQVSGDGTWNGQGALPPGWTCTGTVCLVTLENARTSLQITKQWSPGPSSGAGAEIRVTFVGGPQGDESVHITCTPAGGCTPATLIIPPWVTLGTVVRVEEIASSPNGYQPVSGIGNFVWGQSSQGWQCSRGTCQLSIMNRLMTTGTSPTPTPEPLPPSEPTPIPERTPTPSVTTPTAATTSSTPQPPRNLPAEEDNPIEPVTGETLTASPTVSPTAPATEVEQISQVEQVTGQLLPRTGRGVTTSAGILLLIAGLATTCAAIPLVRHQRRTRYGDNGAAKPFPNR